MCFWLLRLGLISSGLWIPFNCPVGSLYVFLYLQVFCPSKWAGFFIQTSSAFTRWPGWSDSDFWCVFLISAGCTARELSTRRCYHLKWTRFVTWIGGRSEFSCLSFHALYFKTFNASKNKGLSHSAAKLTFKHPSAYHFLVDGRWLLLHNMVKKFMKGNALCIPLWEILTLLGILIWF